MAENARVAKDTHEAGRGGVIKAAERCIRRHGIVKTTMDDIAREAGMSRPSIYRYFTDREELLVALTTKHSRALTKRAHRFIARQHSFAEQLVEGLIYIADHGHRDEFTRSLLTRDGSDFRRLLRSTDAFTVLTAEFWDLFLDAAERNGELKKDIDRRDMHVWLGSVGLMLMSFFEQSPRQPRDYRTFLRTFVVPGFVAAAAQGS
ncbi:TetR/AcrR family transcriptional regulator [Streptomyces sp. NPDC001984]|uniref:TetR/AcrR family transcriptional regulator n=1 Tax=Streptomyces sp. NPDC002619 TaxID=3364655 RepID=UPI0036C6B357